MTPQPLPRDTAADLEALATELSLPDFVCCSSATAPAPSSIKPPAGPASPTTAPHAKPCCTPVR